MKSKKGYFFIVDAIIALFVLVLGIVLALSLFNYETPEKQVQFISSSIMDLIYSNRIKDINNEYLGPKRVLHNNKNITNIDNRLIIQLGEFYYRHEEGCSFCKDLIQKSIRNITGNFIANEYSFSILIEDDAVYNYTVKPINESTVLIPSKTVISGIYNESELWGPYSVEVRAWR